VLVMVSVNNSGDRVGRSHWEESFRKHCRDIVYVCRRCRSSYVRSTSKGNRAMGPVISPYFQFSPDELIEVPVGLPDRDLYQLVGTELKLWNLQCA
jgi:hypothetical protein